MEKKVPLNVVVGIVIGVLVIGGLFSYTFGEEVQEQFGIGTIRSLPGFISTSTPFAAITPRGDNNIYAPFSHATTSIFTVTSLTNCNTIDTDANGLFSCGTDEGGAGSVVVFGDLGDVATSSDGTGDIYYLDSSGQITNLNAGSNGQVLKLSGGIPSWAAESAGGGAFAWTPTTYGVSTSTTLGFLDGFVANGAGSSTISHNLNLDGSLLASSTAVIDGKATVGDLDIGGTILYDTSVGFTGPGLRMDDAAAGGLILDDQDNVALINNDSFTSFIWLSNSPGIQIESNVNGGVFLGTADDKFEFGTYNGSSGVRGILDFSSIASTNKTFTFPNTTGTLALTSDLHDAVTLAGSLDYLTISGQQITRNAIDLTTDVTGTLPETSGGTGQATFTTGDILYADASNSLAKLAVGSDGQVLKLSGGVPTWAGSGSGSVGTSTVPSLTQVPFWTTSGATPELLGGSPAFTFATSTETLTVGSGGAGDSDIVFGPTSFEWVIGFDNTDNSFAIASSTALGTNNLFRITKDGQVDIFGNASTTDLRVQESVTTGVETLTDGATIDIDWSTQHQKTVVLGGNRTLTFSNVEVGRTVKVYATQDGTGSRTLTMPASVTGPDLTLTTTAGKTDILVFSAPTSTATIHGRISKGE